MELSSVRLKIVSKEYVPEIVQMAERIWWHHFPGILSDGQIRYMLAKMYSPEVIEAEIQGEKVDYRFILCREDKVGFCSFGPTEHPGEMKIHKLYVRPHFQGHGYGSGALHCIEEECRKFGYRTMILAVNKHNSGAIHAYKRRGFVIQDSVTVDIGEGFIMDDYILRKELV
jgi:GNAT superfamily N-acetyltransferase